MVRNFIGLKSIIQVVDIFIFSGIYVIENSLLHLECPKDVTNTYHHFQFDFDYPKIIASDMIIFNVCTTECTCVSLSNILYASLRLASHICLLQIAFIFMCNTHLSIYLLNNTCIYRCKRVLITNVQTDEYM